MPSRYTSRDSRRTKSDRSRTGGRASSGRNPQRGNRKEGAKLTGKAKGRGGTKGLTADGSTRAWRRARAALPGKPKRCPDGRPPFVNHKVSRRDGGSDNPSNLEWKCGHNPGVGRPKKSARRAQFRPENTARGRRA